VDTPWNFMAGGAALGLVAGMWGRIKELGWKIASYFVDRVEISTEFAHDAVIAYLITHYPRSPVYARLYGAWHEYQRDGRYGLVSYEVFGTRTLVFWNRMFPFWFSNAQENKPKTNAANDAAVENSATKVYSTVTFFRGTVDIEAILKAACAHSNQQSWSAANDEQEKATRFMIHFVPKRENQNEERGHSSNNLAWYQQGQYRLLSHTPDQLGKAPLHEGKALENLIFPKRIKNLIKEIELWRNSRDWYHSKGIPWKRGWLLYGPPGTGKTALARAFAEDDNMPIYVFNLAEMSNSELNKAWGEMQINVPCIALIEDIDNVFHGRENVARKNGMMPLMMTKEKDTDEKQRNPFAPLTFDCLLNCIDGVDRSDGIFTIITTNDIAKVDPALGQPRKLPDGTVEFISTRPGRIDKAVELTYLEPGDKKLMAERILGDYAEEYQEMLEFIDRFPELQETPAQFQERCGQIALKCFWRDKQREFLGPVLSQPENGQVRVTGQEVCTLC
jgi:hypothetical protein